MLAEKKKKRTERRRGRLIGCCVLFLLAAALLWGRGKVYVTVHLRRGSPGRRFELFRLARGASVWLCAGLLLAGLWHGAGALQAPEYLASFLDESTIYEQYYVDPAQVEIAPAGETKNLLYIYAESMETAYASWEDGGAQPVNYIPELTALARQELSFSETALLGGFHATFGTGWTMGALMGTTSGVPFAYPVDQYDMDKQASFAPSLVTLGDILAERGYNQEFLCGSDSSFAGRALYFSQHGGYRIYDLGVARAEGMVPPDYFVWWGFEDEVLYEIAKKELLALAERDEPFNFAMLTADLHHFYGYKCRLCQDEFGVQTADVARCTDRQLCSFIDWCREQDFFEDTVIVITGDHPRMDTELVAGLENWQRPVYNCFINAAAEPVQPVQGRAFTTLDIFPTVLRAMGFSIPGDRLGLGTDMFSAAPTLAEQLGFQALDQELGKRSDYYMEHFY